MATSSAPCDREVVARFTIRYQSVKPLERYQNCIGRSVNQRHFTHLRFRQLTLISSLGEAGNLHRAAELCSMTQPTATRLLRDAELILGVPLFERHARGMTPTERGQDAIQFSNRIIAQLEIFQTDLATKQEGGHGLVVIGAIMGAAPQCLAKAVTALKRDYPLLTIRILGETSDRLTDMLERGEIEFAVGRYSSMMQHNEFAFEPLANEPLCIVVRAGHALLDDAPTELEQLAQEQWILQPESTIARQLLEAEFAARDMITPQNRVEVSSIFAALQLVRHSDGVAMLSRPVVEDYLSAGMMRELPLPIEWKLSDFGLLTRRGETLTSFARELVDHLKRFAED